MHYCHSKSLPDRAFCNAELLSNLGAGHLLTVDAVAEADILGVTWLNDGIKQSTDMFESQLISGEQQIRDIVETKKYLEDLIAKL